MNEKTTKRALFSSVLAIVLCLAMLIGTTFAWFTDTASTGVNKIQAGNLKMQVTYKNDINATEFTPVSENTAVFDNDALWEPGHVEFVVLKVENVGTLALKYKLGVNIASETGSTNVLGSEFKLSDYINFAVIDGDATETTTADSVTRDDLLTAAGAGQPIKAGYSSEEIKLAASTATEEGAVKEKTVTLVVWMPTTVGNEANYDATVEDAQVPEINLGVNVVATQDTVENDSFDNTYDATATYPVLVNNQTELTDAIKNASKTENVQLKLASGAVVKLDNGIAHEGDKSRNITFTGDGSQTVDVITNAVSAEGGMLNYQRGSTFTFENLTIQAGEGSFDGIVCDELTYKNCTIKGKLTLYGKATFINCTFENDMADQYSVWTWGGTDVTFDGCTFNTNGKAILLYGQATVDKPTNLTVTGCTFNDRNNGTAGKAAIEIGNDYNATYTLTINNITVNGFADGKNTGSKLWANKEPMDTDHLSVTIDGEKVF